MYWLNSAKVTSIRRISRKKDLSFFEERPVWLIVNTEFIRFKPYKLRINSVLTMNVVRFKKG
jgi:hypothetical protein